MISGTPEIQLVMQDTSLSSLLIAGTGGDSGKTLTTLSIISALRQKNLAVAAFKKGPDYIDAAWLSWAAGCSARNLDTYLFDSSQVRKSFFVNSFRSDFAIIEGNRGLYDGMDSAGSHSSAELAKLLNIPVVLLVDASKVTRTTAAIVLGCIMFDPQVIIAGVIFNRTAGSRHESVLEASLKSVSELPILGFIPKLKDDFLPGRHLGLVTPAEHLDKEKLQSILAGIAEKYLDMEELRVVAGYITPPGELFLQPEVEQSDSIVRIAVFSDSAFTFYYPENLEALKNAGAEIISVSSLDDKHLPECDGLYIGGGFPETHLLKLSQNRSLMLSVRLAADNGMPIYAECGGLIYLCQSLLYEDSEYPLAGIFPLKLKMEKKPQGHGYCELEVDSPNPFFSEGIKIRGHEFHYTRILDNPETVETCFRMNRGIGCGGNVDGLIYKNCLAAYTHIHALGNPQWASNFVEAAVKNRKY